MGQGNRRLRAKKIRGGEEPGPLIDWWRSLYLEITLKERDQLAKDFAKDEISQQLAYECEWHAEYAQQQVGDGQIEQKHVGDGPHPRVL